MVRQDSYLDELKATLAGWHDEVESLTQKSQRLSAEHSGEIAANLVELRRAKDEVEQRMTRAFHADDAEWEGLRLAVEDAVDGFKRLLEQITADQVRRNID